MTLKNLILNLYINKNLILKNLILNLKTILNR